MSDENDQYCSCGKHRGIGQWSPEDRAAAYKRIYEKIPSSFTGAREAWLRSWAKEHGKVEYELVEAGKNDGKLNPDSKGLPVYKAVLKGQGRTAHTRTPPTYGFD